MSSKVSDFVHHNLRDVVVSSLVFSAALLILAVLYGRTGSLYELLSKLAFAILIAVIVRLTTVFLYGERVNDSSFQEMGFKSVKYLNAGKVGEFLKDAKRIDVMKTWFPDHPHIRKGLREALKNKRATIRLLLSHPDSDLLRARSEGAGEKPEHGADEVMRTLKDVYEHTQDDTAKFEVALYKGWPGCPIIWHDGNVLLGFYLRGQSSPFWPWIAVEDDSPFGQELRDQFDKLWKDETTRKITGKQQLGEFLLERQVQTTSRTDSDTQQK